MHPLNFSYETFLWFQAMFLISKHWNHKILYRVFVKFSFEKSKTLPREERRCKNVSFKMPYLQVDLNLFQIGGSIAKMHICEKMKDF